MIDISPRGHESTSPSDATPLGKVLRVDFTRKSSPALPEGPRVTVSAANALGVEDGRVYLVLTEGEKVSRIELSPEDGVELAQRTAIVSKVADRRRAGLYELHLYSRTDVRVKARAPVLCRLLESRLPFVLLESVTGDYRAWYSVQSGEPVQPHRDRRRSFLKLYARDAQFLRTQQDPEDQDVIRYLPRTPGTPP